MCRIFQQVKNVELNILADEDQNVKEEDLPNIPAGKTVELNILANLVPEVRDQRSECYSK